LLVVYSNPLIKPEILSAYKGASHEIIKDPTCSSLSVITCPFSGHPFLLLFEQLKGIPPG